MMNTLMLNKGGAIACLILLCLFLVQGCKKDILQPNSKDLQNGLSIVEAKDFFEKNLQISTKSKTFMSTTSGIQHPKVAAIEDVINNKQPIWDKAYQNLISTGLSVKIPIDFNQSLAVIGSKKEVLPLSSLNYLLMYKDRLQQVHAEWVLLQPDSSWLYGSRESYHGKVYISDWNGSPIKKLTFPATTASINKSAKNKNGFDILGHYDRATETLQIDDG